MKNNAKKYSERNIIHVTPYFPPSIGGIQTVVYQITNKLSLKGYKVTILTSKPRDKSKLVNNTGNLKIKYIKSFELFNTPVIINLIGNLFKIPKNSVVHIHIAHILTPEISSFIAKIRGIPYVAHIHGTINSYSSLEKILSLYRKLVLKKVLLNAHYVVVPTMDYKEKMVKQFNLPKEKIIVIPSALNLKIGNYAQKTIKNPIKLLFIGRLVEQKNPLLLIKIIKRLNEEKIPAILEIVGEGELKSQIITEIKNNNLQKSIKLTPYITGDKISNVYLNSDILLFPSHWETFGTVVIEAMASGLPVIANNIPGVKNIITDRFNGLLVNNTTKSYYYAILELLENKTLYNNLRKNGLKEAKKYDLNSTILNYENLYANI